MSDISALLFDMDGLLLDSERVYVDAAVDVLRPHGVAPDAAHRFFLTLVGASSAVAEAEIDDFLPSSLDPVEFHDAWHGEVGLRLRQHVPLKPHVANCLAALSGRLPMAVVTSTHTELAEANLASGGIRDHFAFVLGCDQVDAHKPDPAPYLKAAGRLGVSPTQCAAFEDSDRGVTSAARAGCRVMQIPDLRPPGVPLPDLGQHVAEDLRAALQVLALM